MGRLLKELYLPLLVEEARKRGEGDVPVSSPHSSPKAIRSQQFSSSSTVTASDASSPTFSRGGHSRLGSSTSSLASSPPLRDSIDGFGTGKRPLTEVKEEPQERNMEGDGIFDDMDRDQEPTEQLSSRYSNLSWSLDDSPPARWPEYALGDDAFDNDFAPNPIKKRQRASTSPSPFNGLTSRMTSSISRQWRPRKITPPMPGQDAYSRTPSLSRANSTRAPSFASVTFESNKPPGHPLPLTPTKSAHDEGSSDFTGAIADSQKRISGHDEDVEDQAKPTTPLLPPIMTQIPDDIKEIPYQSPLQSPSVAGPESPFVTPLPTPQLKGLPSPPLSSKPSTASFQRQRGCMPAVSPSEIPPMLISGPDDAWADVLGHANFTIYPEPYEPSQPDLDTCKQLRADWETARHNYAKHLMRTGENYGPTSEIYLLTEEKWVQIERTWKRSMRKCWAVVKAGHRESGIRLSRREVIGKSPPLIKMPSLNGPKSEGKFPKLGDEGIVGPMEVVAPPMPLQQQQPPPRRKRKLGFFRWVQGVWPVGAGVFGRASISGP